MLKHKQYYKSILNIQNFSLTHNISDKVRSSLIPLFSALDPITYYMIEGRFITGTKKIKKESSGLTNSPELNKMLTMMKIVKGAKKKGTPLNLLDVIKAYKILEQQLYHRGERTSNFNDLQLGHYDDCLVKASDSITTLFICIQSMTNAEKRATLSLAHSCICIYRQFNVKARPDAKTITDPYNGTLPLEEVILTYFTDKKIDHFLSKYIDLSKMCDFDKLFIYSGNASSPNSGHSNINYLADAAGLYKDKALFDSVKALAMCFSNGKCLADLMYVTIEDTVANRPLSKHADYIEDKNHSRIVTFTAPGGKARIIAVADWITQTALSAIHKTQFQLLQLIPADRTFNHKSGLDLYDKNAGSFVSVDLSAATDRLPRILQSRIIDRLYTLLGMNGPEIARYWLASIDRTYTTKNSLLQKHAPELRYSVGQGMGLFSSWSSMALMHHFIVNELCGIETDNYRLVGDDLLIKENSEGFEIYKRILQEIGVPINQSKTLVSTQAPHTIEFARNYIIEGEKISSIPFGCIFSYYDEKTSASEILYNFLETFDFINPSKVLEWLGITDFKELHIIAYFLWKNHACSYSELTNIVSVGKHLGLIFTEEHLAKIEEICRTESPESSLRPSLSFYETLLSQCTMRRQVDLDQKRLIGGSVLALEYTDPAVSTYCDVMSERMDLASAPCYLPGLGNPTTTKRERRLIVDFYDYLLKTDKSLRLLKYSKRQPKK